MKGSRSPDPGALAHHEPPRDVRPKILESERRGYRFVRVTLVYELRVTFPWDWRRATTAALERMAPAALAAAAWPPPVNRSTGRARADPLADRGHLEIPAAELVELRASGVRNRAHKPAPPPAAPQRTSGGPRARL